MIPCQSNAIVFLNLEICQPILSSSWALFVYAHCWRSQSQVWRWRLMQTISEVGFAGYRPRSRGLNVMVKMKGLQFCSSMYLSMSLRNHKKHCFMISPQVEIGNCWSTSCQSAFPGMCLENKWINQFVLRDWINRKIACQAQLISTFQMSSHFSGMLNFHHKILSKLIGCCHLWGYNLDGFSFGLLCDRIWVSRGVPKGRIQSPVLIKSFPFTQLNTYNQLRVCQWHWRLCRQTWSTAKSGGEMLINWSSLSSISRPNHNHSPLDTKAKARKRDYKQYSDPMRCGIYALWKEYQILLAVGSELNLLPLLSTTVLARHVLCMDSLCHHHVLVL